MWICLLCETRYEEPQNMCFCGSVGSIVNIPVGSFRPRFQKNGRLKTALELKESKVIYKTIPGFEFLANVYKKFMMLVYGPPGSGKSIFSLKLANELVTDKRKVLYISAEESHSATMRKKIVDFGIKDNLLVLDESNYEVLVKDISTIKPFAVVIDSCTMAKLKENEASAIYKSIEGPLILVTHITVEDRSKGGTGIPHLTDIVIYIENGIAINKKNRFAGYEEMVTSHHVISGLEEKIGESSDETNGN